MRLEKVFEMGHHVAVCRQRGLHAVYRPPGELWPEGHYLVEDADLPALAQGREVPSDAFEEPVTGSDLIATDWAPEILFCWCDQCVAWRRESMTRPG